MPSIPGLKADVFFGDTQKPLPDWRENDHQSPDEAPLHSSERRALIGVLGFDPRELWKVEPSKFAEAPEQHDPLVVLEAALHVAMESVLRGDQQAHDRAADAIDHIAALLDGDDAEQFAEYHSFDDGQSDWVRDPGPRSKDRWRNSKTGKILYAKAPPGSRKKKGEVPVEDRHSVEDVVSRFSAFKADPSLITADAVRELASRAMHLSPEDAQKLKAQLGVDDKRVKKVQTIIDHAVGQLKSKKGKKKWKDRPETKAHDTLKDILGDAAEGLDLGDKDAVRAALQKALAGDSSGKPEPERPEPPEGGGRTPEEAPESGGRVEEETPGPADTETDQGGDDTDQPDDTRPAARVPTQQSTSERVPADTAEVNKRLDRFQGFFNSRGQHMVADWLGQLQEHVNAVGAESALEALGPQPEEGKGSAETVQYWGVGTEESNWRNMGDWIEGYLARNGIIAVTGDTSDPDKPLISALGKPDKFVTGDFKPASDAFKNKLDEAKHLPGLETSEDMAVLMGRPVTHLTDDVIAKLDETHGKGQWIVKCYDDNAAAGYGIFFPQRASAISQDARNTLWTAGEQVGRYGFELKRDEAGKVVGLKHSGGDEYLFGTEKYESTIHGDVRHWGDKAAGAADHEKGAKLPEGSFMAQPAFPAVGISDADRAAGKTWHESNEGRVHLVTRADGSVEVVPHATWLKGGNLPVVFEDDDTRAMAKAASDAVNQLPPEARKGQVYAPDVMKTAAGYKVVELNAQGDFNGSGYLHDNHFTIDAYTSHLVGREPAHVAFIRNLLTKRKKGYTP